MAKILRPKPFDPQKAVDALDKAVHVAEPIVAVVAPQYDPVVQVVERVLDVIEVVLQKDLTRNGIIFPAGTRVEVPVTKLEWLHKTGTIL